MAVCSYYNVGPKFIETYKRKVKSDPDEGTYYRNMATYAETLGLTVRIETEMPTTKLRKYLNEGKPVICSIQAWSDESDADYTKNGNGHYVVAIGYDEKHIYFMDPSANYEGAPANPRYGYLTTGDFELRWHEDEGIKGKKEPYQRLGMVIYPKDGSPLLRARRIE